jgi:large-conductance mechanosensitive channel
MDPGADSPKQFLDGLKLTIFRRRIGQIALAVILAESCIRYLNALVWFLIIPLISNVLETHTESVLFKNRRTLPLPWEQLIGNTIEFASALVFVYFANRWIYGLSRPRRDEPVTDAEAISSAVTSEDDPDPSLTQGEPKLAHLGSNESPRRSEG